MGNFLHDIVNAEYSDNQFSGSSTGILPDVLHVGFNEFADFSSIFGHMPAAPTHLQPSTIGDMNRLTNSHGGTETPAVQRAVNAGEQAFRESMWLWDPSMEDNRVAEQIHLTLPGYQSLDDHQARESDLDLQLSSMSRDKLLLMILDTCDPRAQRQVVSRFPSMSFLSCLLADFKARHSRQISPWIHFPTIDLENECEEFLGALICAGAADSRRPEVRKLGFALQEAARLAIAKRFEEDNRNLRDLRSMQAFLVVLNVGLNSASRRKIEIAESYTLHIVTMLRRGGRFRNRWKGRSEANNEDQNQDLEVRWRRWAEEESFKRLVYHVLFQDVQTSVALFRQPVTSYSEINLPMPCAAEIWEAESAELWWQEILRRPGQLTIPQITLPECLQDGGLLSLYNIQIDIQMSLRVMVSNFWLRVWQSIQMRPFLSPGDSVSRLATMSASHQQLVAAGEDLIVRFSEGSFSMHPSVKMMLELAMMHLHVSLEDIQQLAGNEGEEGARKAASRLRAWIKLPESRRALFHAGQIARATAECPPQYVRGFHAVMVYHASLTMWAYTLLATSQNGVQAVQATRIHRIEYPAPIVWLDGEEVPELRRFMLLGTGTACIRKYTASNFNGKDNELGAVPLTDPAEIMVSMAGLLSSRDESDYYCIPIVSYLTRLMHSLAKASAAMKLSR
ncbi:uncharacterized protein A1O9_06781 [Exophiala aquamarina CBS 119918]|uniref:Xylanolytic transcriptional activator regulatory domain-containing protein n=1 Tax=Exophiala aquamarina CBS 119918 TaxID=1182545 RepID=A0A072PA03_9EURO|nr:uncharacterized protein A1O9_06781 [Exophiala aquamarina CBS 119918]KEF56592.1 hypothetical protein A1O9_06781 [Exophiala aquamarina CBS 119918]